MKPRISATEAAAALNLSRARIKLLCQQGRIKGASKVGTQWVIPSPVEVIPAKRK